MALTELPVAPTERLIIAVRALASARCVEDVVEVVRHAARELVNADGATFVFRDDDKCHYVDEDAIEPLWRGQRFPLEACISGWAMLHREQVVIPDIYADDRIPHDAYRPTFVQSLAMTPVRADDPVAAIGTYWADNHLANAWELELLQALADSTAVAIENVRLLSELEARVQSRTAALEAANRDLRSFAHLAAHDLRNPLLTSSAYVQLALKVDGDKLSDEGREYLDGALSSTERMTRLLEAVLQYSTAGEQDLEASSVDMNVVVGDVLADLSGLVEQRGATVTVGELPVVTGHQALLERCVQNLISNAIAYGDADHPTVEVVGGETADAAWVSVIDNGSGVPDAEKASVFEMFKRGKAGRETEGFGIGLAFVARVIQRLGGTIEVADGAAGGAVFTLTLPR